MDLATIEVSPEEAEAKFEEYRKVVASGDGSEEDRRLLEGYRALRRGGRLIRLTPTIERGGFTEQGIPRLAMARLGSAPTCFAEWLWNWSSNQRLFRYSPRANPHPGSGFPSGVLSVALGQPGNFSSETWQALVPSVPPNLRPRPSRGYSKFWVLWEAEWRLANPRAPGDPALLRRVRGDLWAVLAVWDLTELERAVLEERP